MFNKNIIHFNQMRLKRFRLTRLSISSLENARVTILFRNWKSLPIGSCALSSSIKILNREYRRLQPGFYLPQRLRGPVTSWYFSSVYPLIRFSPYYVLREGSSLLDIGADAGIASALAARTPAIRIAAIELDPYRGVFSALIFLRSC